MVKYNDPPTIAALVDAFGKGASVRIACDYARIDVQCYYNWIERAQKNEQPFVEIIERIKKAAADGDTRCLEKIDEAVKKGTWQAAAWKLERRHPHDYGNNPALIDLNRRLASLEKAPHEEKADEKTEPKEG